MMLIEAADDQATGQDAKLSPSAPKPASARDERLREPEAGADDAIRDDRDFLKALGMSDRDASVFLGKTRQTLNNMLGSPKDKSGTRATDYLRCADMFTLIGAARNIGNSFDPVALEKYILEFRKDDPSRDLVLDVLRTRANVDWGQVYAMIMVLPEYQEIKRLRPVALSQLHDWVGAMQSAGKGAQVVCLSETPVAAEVAGQELGLERSQCIGDSVTENYLPMTLLYSKGKAYPDILVMTEHMKLEVAPHFREKILAACVERLLGNNQLASVIRNERNAAALNEC